MAVSYSDPEVLRRTRLCLKKKMHKSEERAWEVCKKMYRRYGDLMGPFKCGYCEGFHIGHPRNLLTQAELRLRARSW